MTKNILPIDKVAIPLIILLSLLIAVLIFTGDHTAPKVRNFSWENQQIGAEDSSFSLTFTRPMNQESVEKNIQVTAELSPPVPITGKISWAGRKMAYTLISPPPYGTNYKLELAGAIDKFSEGKKNVIEPFIGKFSTRDRIFAYIGIEKDEKGILMLYNLTKQQKVKITPNNLLVMDFRVYPDGDKILFSASDYNKKQQLVLEQKLYTVTTGINFNSEVKNESETGKIELILDNDNYQNLKFDLATDGKSIVVQRINRKDPAEVGFWIVRDSGKIDRLETPQGGEFMITPDASAIAITQGQGIAILPIPQTENPEQGEVKPLDFLAQFQQVLNFTKDGTKAAMVKYNTNYTKSLFLVTNQGQKTEVLKTTGSILSCQFHPTNTLLFCLLTNLVKGKEFREQPYLAAIDLAKGKLFPLLVLPEQRDIKMSLSPDGLVILFDQIVTTNSSTNSENLTTTDNQDIGNSSLWFYPLTFPFTPTDQVKPEQLPLPGLRPAWFP
jgi:Bacterial Ig-like domain